MKNDYFTNNSEKIVYDTVSDFVTKYNSLPTKEALSIELQEIKINEEEFKETMELLDDISRDLMNYDLEFRIQELESKFSVDMSESTFNELKELKKKQNLN